MKYFWTVISNLIVLLVALKLFGIPESSFERVVISVLILIYVTLVFYYSNQALTTVKIMIALDQEFRNVKDLFKKREPQLNESFGTAGSNPEINEQLHVVEVKYWINAGFGAVISAVAIYNLITI